jgi:hypothetical protein
MDMLSSSLPSSLLIAGLGLFVVALLSPGIVYKPDVRSNTKSGECAFAVKEDVQCESFSFGGSGMSRCAKVEGNASGKIFVDKGKILDYCKGWQEPVAQVDYGYKILLMGVLGVFVWVFAWFANPLMLLALALAKFKKRMGAGVASILAVGLGLQSYMLKAVPFNESSMDPGNLFHRLFRTEIPLNVFVVADRLGLRFVGKGPVEEGTRIDRREVELTAVLAGISLVAGFVGHLKFTDGRRIDAVRLKDRVEILASRFDALFTGLVHRRFELDRINTRLAKRVFETFPIHGPRTASC